MNPFLAKHLHSCTSQKVEREEWNPAPDPEMKRCWILISLNILPKRFLSKTLKLQNWFHKLLTKVTNPPPLSQTILVVLFIANSPQRKKSEDQRFVSFILLTPPKTNTSLENQWLEDKISYGNGPFWGTFVHFRRCILLIFLLW